ncbi:MAG: hypothetical protein ACI9G1_004530 [Pirellulaceae bacterium]|jgi:hypothetical protein
MKYIPRNLLAVVCAVLALGLLLPSQALAEVRNSKQTGRPNIILFLVDDMGWQDTSVPFHDEVTDFNRRLPIRTSNFATN